MKEQRQNPTRDKLRSLTLGKPQRFQSKLINYFPPIYEDKENETVIIGYDKENPIQVMVRQPTVRERNLMIDRCRRHDGTIDEMEFIVQAAIELVYDPESGDKLYDKTDYDVLVNGPSGDFLDQFGAEAIQLLNLGEPGNVSSEDGASQKTK